MAPLTHDLTQKFLLDYIFYHEVARDLNRKLFKFRKFKLIKI